MHIDETERRSYELMLWDLKKISVIEDDQTYPWIFSTIEQHKYPYVKLIPIPTPLDYLLIIRIYEVLV